MELHEGMKVRVLRTDYPEIPVGTITHIVRAADEDASLWCKEFPDGLFFFGREFEPASKFAVGDRVRFTGKCRSIWWFGPHTEHKEGVISTVNEKSYRYDVTVDGESFPAHVDGEHIVLVTPATATLTIREGGYYKTRDGRKVGPMEDGGEAHDTDEAVMGADVKDVRRLWRVKGGKHLFNWDYLDLIAEWVDEPVASVQGKFKAGDRVEIAGCDGSKKRYNGTQFTIDKDEGDFNYEQSWSGKDHNSPYRFKESELRLVAPAASAPAIVALIENGQPRPSANPFVHAEREAATKEARRLAGKHKGQEFGVYELVDTERQARVYEHEWQRLAAGGRKIDAIKRVRDATDFTLKGAKDAVEHWLAVEAA